MFKRVKSLVTAGVLVLGMAVTVFANSADTTYNAVYDNYVSKMNVGNVTGDTQNRGQLVRHIQKEHMIGNDAWNAFITGDYGINNHVNDGLVADDISSGQNEHDGHTHDAIWKIYFDANFNDALDEGDELIETIYINFNKTSLAEKGNINPLVPTTGDLSSIAYAAGTGVALLGGIVLVNKKRKNK